MPVKFSQWPDRMSVDADLLGEHNDEVLRDLLALSDSDLAALYADKVLVRDPVLDMLSAASSRGARSHDAQ
jgi:hypothetical protein